ncbi:hypothetical protein TeGR_g13735 [Tetraparma gracilis]|jgi:hypothetical protein|uniref:C3H1-type domain-containing protein n=1 Tax=Tetraparma gracilis TaxID=2962635 RepID=A0ABQ6M935_9STRA|nr:hypothetical protein TeGR_g13735 [Tetraparma gracilis]
MAKTDREEGVVADEAVEQTSPKKAKTDEVAADDAEASEYSDIELSCRDCNAAFTFTVGEQEFFASKGFDAQPTRCKPCKDIKKNGGREPRAGGNSCYAFQKGECTRGDQCRFSHDGEASGGGARPSFGADRPKGVCYAWGRGDCSRGSECRFEHQGEAGAAPSERPSRVCFAWGNGSCSRGDECRFTHEGESGATPSERPARTFNSDRPQGTCYAHQKGECTRGDSCRFSHAQ